MEEEKVILTLRCLQELEMFSPSPGMYGRTKVLSSEMTSEVETDALIVLGTLDKCQPLHEYLLELPVLKKSSYVRIHCFDVQLSLLAYVYRLPLNETI